MIQINDNYNTHGFLLDLILPDDNRDKFRFPVDPVLPVDDYHPPLLHDLVIENGSPKMDIKINNNTGLDFKNAYIFAICTSLREIGRSNLLTSATVDEAVGIFFSRRYLTFDYIVPIKKLKNSSPPPPNVQMHTQFIWLPAILISVRVEQLNVRPML